MKTEQIIRIVLAAIAVGLIVFGKYEATIALTVVTTVYEFIVGKKEAEVKSERAVKEHVIKERQAK